MDYTFCDIGESKELIEEAANILKNTFKAINKDAWPTFESALQEVKECIENPNICIGLCVEDKLVGWIGLRPMYEKTWELHPIVIATEYHHRGLGKILITELEKRAREKGLIGIVLGTDDETNSTSLSQCDINEQNIYSEIAKIRNLKEHPYEFYQKCGYIIIGVVPNANGIKKPDIQMWKSLL